MCGKVFCQPCTEFQKRLSTIGAPDPTGRLHPVCALCIGAESQKVGQIRNDTETLFMEFFSKSACAYAYNEVHWSV